MNFEWCKYGFALDEIGFRLKGKKVHIKKE